LAGELGRVPQQVADDLRQAIPVGVDQHGSGRGMELEIHLGLFEERALIL
jgi:hypothetical protein